MNRNFSLKHEFQPQNGDPRRHRRNLIWLIQDGRPCTAERSPYVTSEDFLLEESNSGRWQPKTFVAHFATNGRDVQYVHWVMHKCIMVKVGGKRNTSKVCKKQVNFSKTRGKFVKAEGK